MVGSGGGEGDGHGRKKKKIRPLMEQKLSMHYVPERYIEPRPWYNIASCYSRWGIAAQRAQSVCPKDPKGRECQEFVELLVDCPEEYLEDIPDLPPLTDPSKPVNIPPLELPDRCKLWKWWHDKCLEYNKMNSEWKCLPFEDVVEEHCPSDWRCTKKASPPWEGVEAWLWG